MRPPIEAGPIERNWRLDRAVSRAGVVVSGAGAEVAGRARVGLWAMRLTPARRATADREVTARRQGSNDIGGVPFRSNGRSDCRVQRRRAEYNAFGEATR
jgi:hypothetical protein